jgi:hypothetical protein
MFYADTPALLVMKGWEPDEFTPQTVRSWRGAARSRASTPDRSCGSWTSGRATSRRWRDRLLARLGPQTVSDVLRVLSQALHRAEARGLVARNVADPALVHRPTGDRRDFVVIDAKLEGRKHLQCPTRAGARSLHEHDVLGRGHAVRPVGGLAIGGSVTQTVTRWDLRESGNTL